MIREEQIKKEALFNCNDIAGEVDYKSTAAYEGFIKGAEWADKHPNGSLIKWQKGEPKEKGMYLVTTKDGLIRTAQFMIEYGIKTWAFGLKVISWCPLSDIEPYKEDKEEQP